MSVSLGSASPCISATAVMVTLDCGNKAVYLTEPQHMPRDDVAESCHWPSMYGKQLAVNIGGDWYRPGGGELIDDLRTIALLERAPEFETHQRCSCGETPRS